MNCPFCVTRPPRHRLPPDDAIGGVRRHHECRACSRLHPERVELGSVAIVKKDDRREEFDRR
jgi:transcriptional regulator NrdR family protein